MNKAIAEQWAAELESGKYEQGRAYLCDRDGRFCCLGVLCEMAIRAGVPLTKEEPNMYEFVRYDKSCSLPPRSVLDFAGLKSLHGNFAGRYLTEENDSGKTFPEIAALIREHAEEL